MTARTSTDGRFQAAPAHRPSFSSRVQVDVSALSHQGYQRTSNEDHFLVAKLSRSLQTLMTSLPAGHVPDMAEEVNYVMIVADGMGGHVAGEVASRMAIADLIGLALELPDWILRMDD